MAALAALSSGAALGAGPGPDSHDRALARQLDSKKRTFDKLAARKNGGFDSIVKSLDRCPRAKLALEKAVFTASSASAFARQFYPLEAAVTAQAVDVLGPEYREFSQMMLAMHPHSRLFARWLGVKEQNLALILRFDNHGKTIDLCKVDAVILDKNSTAEDIHRVLGIDLPPSEIAALTHRLDQSPGSTKLELEMHAFFVAAGLPAADAKDLSSF